MPTGLPRTAWRAIIAASSYTAAAGSLAVAAAPYDTTNPRCAAGCDDPLLVSARFLPTCFPADLSREDLRRAIAQFDLRAPTQLAFDPHDRFVTDTVVWQGAAGLGQNGQASRASLTYSFPDDGVQWGLAAIHAPSVGPNDLNQRFINTFGDIDRGREFVRQSLASWARSAGLDYREVRDDNSPMDASEIPDPARGDIRIGGAPAAGAGFLGYNAFPSATGTATVGGGDMFIATNNFNILQFNNPANNFRAFRNTVVHEHGHGLGMIHVVPCNQTKVMEPQVPTNFDGVSVDDIRGAGRSYGDRYAGNHTPADAHDFGDLSSPSTRSIIERDLSLNGAAGPNGTHTDWFRFRLSAPGSQSVSILAIPTGGVYDNAQQTTGCNGAITTIDANAAGDILLELQDLNSGQAWLSNTSGPGVLESIAIPALGVGDYAIRVTDTGPNAHQIVQLYTLSISVGTAPHAPVAIAGVDKRCRAGAPCWFMGHINSYTTAPGATITSYEWDIDGDGVFDASGAGEFSFVYPSTGVFPVTLRVTDSFGTIATDTILVETHTAATRVLAVSPASAYRGETVTVVVDGANFLLPTGLTLSGVGWTATSLTPIDTLGTQAIATITIDPGATPGLRDIRVSNSDGVDTGAQLFEILLCAGDTNGDRLVNFADLNTVLSEFGMTGIGLAGDLNSDGVVNFADLNIVLSNFGNSC